MDMRIPEALIPRPAGLDNMLDDARAILDEKRALTERMEAAATRIEAAVARMEAAQFTDVI